MKKTILALILLALALGAYTLSKQNTPTLPPANANVETSEKVGQEKIIIEKVEIEKDTIKVSDLPEKVVGKVGQEETKEQGELKKIDETIDEADEFGRHVASECQIVSLCNGPIECMNGNIDASSLAGTCQWKEEYACFKEAYNICEVQDSGNCGWSKVPELVECIASTSE